jgi:hypothetical protein
MRFPNTTLATGISRSASYHRDPTVPFWRLNVDVDTLFEAHAHRPDRAQAWLRHRNVTETCSGFRDATMMRGHFEAGILSNHVYHWTFTPGHKGDPSDSCPSASRLPTCRFCRHVTARPYCLGLLHRRGSIPWHNHDSFTASPHISRLACEQLRGDPAAIQNIPASTWNCAEDNC